MALINFIMIDHTLEYRTSKTEFWPKRHACGSFMGEPVSFMGLTLYNLCCGEIADFWQWKLSKADLNWSGDWTRASLTHFACGGKFPTGYVVITGDDRTEITDQRGKFHILNQVYVQTNGKPSPGKNTVSCVHGVHAENHIYLDAGSNIYLDVIKPKLLTPSTRFHSDNRSSIIGKGSSLFLQLHWLEESTFFDSKALAKRARYLYIDMMQKGFFPREMSLCKRLPIGLPPSVGGISFPISMKEADVVHQRELRFLWWLLNKASVEEFTLYAMRIQDISSEAKRGLPYQFGNSYWGKVLSSQITKSDLRVVREVNFEDTKAMFSLYDVLCYVKEHVPSVPVSHVTGMPQVTLAIRHVFKTWGYVPLEAILDLMERQCTFFKAFDEGVEKRGGLSFRRYLTNLKRFWNSIQEDTGHIDLTEPHQFKSMDDIHWRFQQRLRTFIHTDLLCDGALTSGPSLHLDLTRLNGPSRTKHGLSEDIAHAIWAYVRGLHEDDHDTVIYRPEWASAQSVSA